MAGRPLYQLGRQSKTETTRAGRANVKLETSHAQAGKEQEPRTRRSVRVVARFGLPLGFFLVGSGCSHTGAARAPFSSGRKRGSSRMRYATAAGDGGGEKMG